MAAKLRFALLCIAIAISVGFFWILLAPAAQDGEEAADEASADSQETEEQPPEETEPETEEEAPADPIQESSAEVPIGEDDIEDLDAHLGQLQEGFASGDAAAARELAELAQGCLIALQIPEDEFRQEIAETDHPDARARLEEQLEEARSQRDACMESDLADPHEAIRQASYWTWAAADAGDPEAGRSVIFGGMAAEQHFQAWAMEEEHDIDELEDYRRAIAEKLRASCDATALGQFADRFQRNMSAVEGLESTEHEDQDDETARALEAFAHGYAAARLEEHPQPAREARSSEHSLTPGQEERARQLGQSMIEDC